MISVSDDERTTRTWEPGLFDRLVRDVHAVPPVDASRPVRIAPIDAPNVFEQPRLPTDPPPPWTAAPAQASRVVRTHEPRIEERRRGGGWLSVVLGAALGAAITLAAIHPPARAAVDRAFDRAVKAAHHRL